MRVCFNPPLPRSCVSRFGTLFVRAVNPANRLSEALRQDDYQALIDHAGVDNPDNGSVYHTDVYVSGGQDTAHTYVTYFTGEDYNHVASWVCLNLGKPLHALKANEMEALHRRSDFLQFIGQTVFEAIHNQTVVWL